MASFESDENEGRERINRKHNGTFHSHWPGSNENLLIKNEKKKKKKKKKKKPQPERIYYRKFQLTAFGAPCDPRLRFPLPNLIISRGDYTHT